MSDQQREFAPGCRRSWRIRDDSQPRVAGLPGHSDATVTKVQQAADASAMSQIRYTAAYWGVRDGAGPQCGVFSGGDASP